MKIGFVTYKDFPIHYGSSVYQGTTNTHLTASDEAVAHYLKKEGFQPEALCWDDELNLASEYDHVIIRSTWNYYHTSENIERFLTFLDSICGKLHNPKNAIKWNYNKRYLDDLQAKGIPIVPTAFIETEGSSSTNFSHVKKVMKGQESLVIKPAISGDGRNTFRLSTDKLEEDFNGAMATFLSNKIETALLQPFMESAITEGEISLVFFNNLFSHAVRRKSSPRNFANPCYVSNIPSPPQAAITLGEECLFQTYKLLNLPEGSLLYARIDLLPDGHGGFMLSEVELIEPELFVQHSAFGVENFGNAILSVI